MSDNEFEQSKNDKIRKEQLELIEKYRELDFKCEYSDNVPKILKELNISLAFTSYQAGRLMLVRSDGDQLDVNYKAFPRPMGLSASEDGLTLGVFTQVIHFQREDGLLEQIKKPIDSIDNDITAPRIKPLGQANNDELLKKAELSNQLNEDEKQQLKKFEDTLSEPVDDRTDACFITRSSHYSGMINIHDIAWGDDELWAVNSSFSCLCTFSPDSSFIPRWKPYFISELKPEDRCHLNGMALKDGKPAYVTTFSMKDDAAGWRNNHEYNGTLMDVKTNRVLLDGLAMPHSPRWYNDKVYFCNSSLGELCSYEPENGSLNVLADLPGFTRGIDFYGPILFVGLSKVREGNVAKASPLSEKHKETLSGIWLINLEDNTVIGCIKFTGNVDQIYDVAVLPNCTFPELLEPNHPRMRNHFCHPELKPQSF